MELLIEDNKLRFHFWLEQCDSNRSPANNKIVYRRREKKRKK